MWEKIGAGLFRFRYLVIFCVLLVGIFFSSFGLKLAGILNDDGFRTPGDYQTTEKILQQDFKVSRNTVVFYIEKKKSADKTAFQQELKDLVKQVENIPNKDVFRHPFNTPNMLKDNAAYLAVLMQADNDKEYEQRSLRVTNQIENHTYETFTIKGFGYNNINKELNDQTQKDLKKAEFIGIPIAFVVLFLSFGTLGASILPILTGGLSVAATMGILYFLGQRIPLSIYVLNVTPMVGLALSIDFALLFVNRFREEVVTKSIREALIVTYRTAGRAILFSALCVVMGLSGLFFFRIDFIQSVGISGMAVVFVSLVISLTLLPAALILVGKRIAQKEQRKGTDSSKRMWQSFGEFVMKRPVWMTIFVCIIILVALLPLRQAQLGFPSIEVLPKNSPTRIAYEKYQATFAPKDSTHASAYIVIEGKKPIEEELATIEHVVNTLKKDKQVMEVNSLFSTLEATSKEIQALSSSPLHEPMVAAVMNNYVKDNRTYVQVYLKDDKKSSEAKTWVADMKGKLKKVDSSFTYYVGGDTKFEQELEAEVMHKALPALGVILGSTFLILMFAFRSILIPLKAILMNVFSLSATVGIIVWLFNGGHFGLEESIVLFTLPVFIFGLVFGLSMDYEVFLISRMHEIYQETGDNNRATLEGLVSTSKIITSAALIMIVVTGAFAFTEILPVKQMGLGIALAIFLDATIIRLILVPSLMKLFGHWNWWFPGQGKKAEAKSTSE